MSQQHIERLSLPKAALRKRHLPNGTFPGLLCARTSPRQEWTGNGGRSVSLLAVTLREMSPVRFGTRHPVIPLLIVVEGYVVARPEVTARMVGGALLIGETTWILFSKARMMGRSCPCVDTLLHRPTGVNCGEWLLQCTSWLRARILVLTSS